MTASEKDISRVSNQTESSHDEPTELEERGQWANPAEFILSCLGYAVGLGNVWRFPYLCYDNGGGAFLIPYFLMLTFVGIPIFMIELTVGQYSASGPGTVWEIAPLFKGVGFGMLVISYISSIYYNLIIAWALYYFAASFAKELPWGKCTNDFNTAFCYSINEAKNCTGVWFNQTCYNNCTDTTDVSLNCYEEWWIGNRTSASEEYFQKGMLNLSDSINDTGNMSWKLVLALIVAWVICYGCILKGIKSSGKVVYFTATFPYLLLLIILIRAVLLPGAKKGILFYLTPKWEKLATSKVWVDAAGQIFFSLSAGTGGLMTFASYNKFNNNIYRDTLIVSIGNCLTSFFAGFGIFSIIGYMSETLGREIDSTTASGSGLAFIAYPEVCTLLPLPQLWAAMFFFMLLTLGLDSQFASLENIQTALTDIWPQLRKLKWATAGILCISMFLLGLTQCTQAGLYWTDLMSYYSSGWSLVLMGMIEGMIFPWIYGANRIIDDIEAMVGFRLQKHWWFVWTFVSPILLVVILIFNFVEFTPLEVNGYVLDGWAQALGWCMTMACVVPIPFFAAYEIYKTFGNPDYDGLPFHKRIWQLCKPTDDWLSQPEKEERARMLKSGKSKPMDYENPAFTERL